MSLDDTAPRLPGHPLLASHLRQWRRDPVQLLTDAARLGRVVRLDLPGRTFLVTHPADVKHVLQDNHQNYCKGWVFDRIKPYWGESLLTADGDAWRRQRHRVQPSFKRERVAGCSSIVTRRTDEMLARWESAAATGGELRMHDEMTRLALTIIGDVLFGLDLWTDVPEMSAAAQAALAVLKRRVAALVPLPLWIPTADNRRFNRAMRVLHRYIDQILERTRGAGDQAPGFLKMLVEARDQDGGSPMTSSACCSRGTTPSAKRSPGSGTCCRCTRRSSGGCTTRCAGHSAIACRSPPTCRDCPTRTWSSRRRCASTRRSG